MTLPIPPFPPSSSPNAPARDGTTQANGDLDSTVKTIGGIAIAAKGLDLIGGALDGKDSEAGLKTDAQAVAGLTPSAAASGKEGRTPGEQRFNFRTYKLTALGTFALSAAALYIARYSKFKVWFGIGGSNKTMEQAWNDTTANMVSGNTLLGRLDLFGWKPFTFSNAKAAGNLLETAATFIGGNIMLSIILPREAKKKEIVHRLNEKYGTAEDVARGDARMDAEPKQNWGSIVGGRIAAFAVVFTSLRAMNKLTSFVGGKFPNSGAGRAAAADGLDAYVNWAGDLTQRAGQAVFPNAGFTQNQGWDKVGKSVAVDAFATAAAVGVLETSSRAIARYRDGRRERKPNDRAPMPANAEDMAKPISFTTQVAPSATPQARASRYTDQAAQELAERTHAEPVRG